MLENQSVVNYRANSHSNIFFNNYFFIRLTQFKCSEKYGPFSQKSILGGVYMFVLERGRVYKLTTEKLAGAVQVSDHKIKRGSSRGC